MKRKREREREVIIEDLEELREAMLLIIVKTDGGRGTERERESPLWIIFRT